MSNTKNVTEDLIASLSKELKPVKCVAHPLKRAACWLVLASLYALLVVIFLGIRGDFLTKIIEPIYFFEVALALSMSLSAALSSHWLCVPDMRGQSWMPVVSITLLTVLAGWLALNTSINWGVESQMHFSHCMTDGLIFGFIPALAIVLLSMRGKTTRPILMIAMNILAVGGVGYVGLRLTCGCDDIWHILIHHVSPFFVISAIIAVIGQKLYNW